MMAGLKYMWKVETPLGRYTFRVDERAFRIAVIRPGGYYRIYHRDASSRSAKLVEELIRSGKNRIMVPDKIDPPPCPQDQPVAPIRVKKPIKLF